MVRHTHARQHWLRIPAEEFLDFLRRYIPECGDDWDLLSVMGGDGAFSMSDDVEVALREPVEKEEGGDD